MASRRSSKADEQTSEEQPAEDTQTMADYKDEFYVPERDSNEQGGSAVIGASPHSNDDLPDEFDDENDRATMPQSAQGSASSEDAYSNEMLGQIGFDDERDAYERRKMTNPVGDWVKADRWEIKQVVYRGDCLPGDINKAGRTVFIITGYPEPRYVNDLEYRPRLTIRLSPDLRAHRDHPERCDNSYKLFNRAKEDLFLSLKDRRPTNLGELIDMLANDQYAVNTMNPSNGLGEPIVLDVKDKKHVRYFNR